MALDMAIDTQEVVRRIEALVESALSDMGVELVKVEYRREQHGWILRLYVDRLEEPGITVGELALVSKMIGPLLDVENVITNPYRLEVSSPGLDRPLGRILDCERFAGRTAWVTTKEALGGRKNFRGILRGRDGDSVLLEEDALLHRIAWELVKKAKLEVEEDV